MSHDAHAPAGPAGFHAPHVVPGMLFFKVLVALLILTVLTVVVAQFHFGSLNMLVAMAIAAVKASLVMTFFMHLRWDTAVNNIAIISSFLFLSLLFLFTLADLGTRGDTDRILVEVPPVADQLRAARDAAIPSQSQQALHADHGGH